MSLYVGGVSDASGEVWIYRRPKFLWRKRDLYRCYCTKHGWLTRWHPGNTVAERENAKRHLHRHKYVIVFDTDLIGDAI